MTLFEGLKKRIDSGLAAYDAATERLRQTATEQFEHGASEYGVATSQRAERRKYFRRIRAFFNR